MALSPTQVDALPEYTNAQMVKLLRNCLAELASSPEASVIGPNNRAYTMRDMDQLQRMLRHFEDLAAVDAEVAAADSGEGSPTLRFVGAPL